MVKSENIIESFGADVVSINLSPEEIFLLKNKNILSSSAVDKVQHLINSSFDDCGSLLKFLSKTLGVDINLLSENIPQFINDCLNIFSEVEAVNPEFDHTKSHTWCEHVDEALNEANNMISNMSDFSTLNESDNIPDEKIKENIYNDLDNNSIVLLYGLMTGSYSIPYSKTMRDTLYNEVKNKKNDSSVGRVVLHSLKEDAIGLGDLMENYDFETCKNVQSQKTLVLEDGENIIAIAKVGNNEYIVEKIN